MSRYDRMEDDAANYCYPYYLQLLKQTDLLVFPRANMLLSFMNVMILAVNSVL